MARLDIFLKHTGLIKQRSEAKRACDAGRVQVDGRAARPGHAVRRGQTIAIETPSRLLEIEVLDIPARPPSRSERPRYFRILRDERRDPYADLSF